jgi:flagellar motor switch protein FliM
MLSQAEIDALLSGSLEIEDTSQKERVNLKDLMGPGAEEKKEAPVALGMPHPRTISGRNIRPYNFWSPDHFSKEHLRAVELIHEDLAERLTASLPSYLHTNLRPRVVHTEHGRFHDFLKDMPPNVLFNLLTLAPLPSRVIITISPDISYYILELVLGGRGEGKRENRSLTEIDQSLIRGMIEHMLNDIKAAWSKVVAIEPGIEDSTINQHWVHMMMGNDRVMLITLELPMQDITGTMEIYIPFSSLKPIINVLNPHVWISGRKIQQANPLSKQRVFQRLSQTSAQVRVILGKAKVTVSDLLSLDLGDVIQLDTPVGQALPVFVAEQKRFLAHPGRAGKYIVAKIDKVIDPTNLDQIGLLLER